MLEAFNIFTESRRLFLQPIFLKPVLQEKIWGGTKLRTQFNLELPNDSIGEAWCISAHPNGVSNVISPAQYKGLGLDELYAKHPELFGDNHRSTFPLLIKILDANDDLSVQVHPDDAYANKHEGEGELGKTECWYIISAEPGASIVYGHHAQSREEFEAMVEAGNWDALLRRIEVKAGDFFYVPHGTIHAIGAGIVILETQQNSDTTYRVYDYNRLDNEGNLRDLHLEQSADVTTFPHQDAATELTIHKTEQSTETHLLSNEFFSVYKWQTAGDLTLDLPKAYYLATVIDGSGDLTIAGQTYPLSLADSFILPHGVDEIKLSGTLTIIASNPE